MSWKVEWHFVYILPILLPSTNCNNLQLQSSSSLCRKMVIRLRCKNGDRMIASADDHYHFNPWLLEEQGTKCENSNKTFLVNFKLCGDCALGSRTKKCTWNWSQDTCLGASLFSICLGMPIMSIWKRQVIHRPREYKLGKLLLLLVLSPYCTNSSGGPRVHAVTGDTHKSSKIFPTSQPPPSCL